MDKNLKLEFKTISQNQANIRLKKGDKIIDHENLTINQDFDTLLIKTIDKLLVKNRIERLSLKTFKIQGKTRSGSVSSMIVRTLKSAIEL